MRTETKVTNANGSLVQTDKYIWQDGKIVSHTLVTPGKSETAKILYDSDKQPRGYILNNKETVLFVKNLQGDVIALVDANGVEVVSYHYDAWGNMTYKPANGTTQAQANRYVKLCPLTYRGYNYDFSTGLYYLQSRYYNPEWGRFLNCDDTSILLSTQGEDHGANLFAYCNNNPVNKVDYTGKYSTGYECLENTLSGIGVLIRMAESTTYSYLINYSCVGVTMDVDKYGLSLFRIVLYDSNDDKYHVGRILFGEMSSWEKYITTENNNYKKRWDATEKFIVDGMSPSRTHTYTSLQAKKADGASGLLFIGTCLVGCGVCELFLLATQKSRYVKSAYNDNSGAYGMVAFGEIEIYSLKSTAIIRMETNLKPRSYVEFMTYE